MSSQFPLAMNVWQSMDLSLEIIALIAFFGALLIFATLVDIWRRLGRMLRALEAIEIELRKPETREKTEEEKQPQRPPAGPPPKMPAVVPVTKPGVYRID